MTRATTIPEALWAAAERRGDVGFTFVADTASPLALPFAGLAARVRATAQALAAKGVGAGDRVALIVPQGHEFVVAFLGAIALGAVPVPLNPPMALGELGPAFLLHMQHIVGVSKSRFVVTNDAIRTSLEALPVRDAAPSLERVFVFAELADGDAARFRESTASLDDVAFIQFTSGSTARPKGVVLRHANVAANAKAINDSLELTPDDAGVSWLPLFHDMGLIGFVIAAIYACTPVTIMPPMMFLKRPATWLKALSQRRATISYAPSFAYALATRRIKDAEMDGIDLASWRVAGCGAEPIQASTLRAFAERFARWGFRATAFVPSYGIAEASLGVTFTRPGRELRVDRVDPARLWADGRAEPSGDARALEIVSCGASFEGHEVRVVSGASIDADAMTSLPDRSVGEIVVRGPSVTSGYVDDAEKTAETIRDGWLVTGDVGYLADGELYICGRRKDLIIVNGKNYYPQDVEWEAAQIDGVREGNVVAFGTSREGLDREEVVVVVETKSLERAQSITHEIKLRIRDALGLTVDVVVPSLPGAIPKTSSGKVQRAKTRALYESGELRRRDATGPSAAAGATASFLKLPGLVPRG